MWPINVNLKLLKVVDFVVDVNFVVVVVISVVNVVGVAMLFVTGRIIFHCGQ